MSTFMHTRRAAVIAVAVAVWGPGDRAHASGIDGEDGIVEAILRDGEAKQLTAAGRTGDVTSGGSFRYSIPIEVPPGRQGVQPTIEIEYDSRRSNGFLGVGWTLSGFPAITRMNWGSGIRYTLDDTFAVLPEGWGSSPAPGGRLIQSRLPVPSGREYFTADNDMDRYEPTGTCGSGPCGWIMHTRGGRTYHFGNTTPQLVVGTLSFTSGVCTETAVICEPKNGASVPDTATAVPRGVAAFLLSRVEDPDRNYYQVTYAGSTTNGSRYPQSIRYTKNDAVALQEREIYFETAMRGDRTPMPNRHDRRLSRIIVRSLSSSGAVINTIRSYLLEYGDPSPVSGRSRLIRVRELAGHDGVTPPASIAELPARAISWTDEALSPWGHPLEPLRRYGASGYGHEFWRLEDDRLWQNHMGDINGDGRADVIRAFQGHSYTYHGWTTIVQYALAREAGGSGEFFDPVTTHTAILPPETGHAPGWRSILGDVNGDGFDDLVLYKVFFTEIMIQHALGSPAGLQPFSTELVLSFPHEVVAPAVSVLPGDIDGDSRMDLVFVELRNYLMPGTRSYYLLSSGVFANPIVAGPAWPGSAIGAERCVWTDLGEGYGDPHSFQCTEPRGTLLRDLNGDGYDDLILVASTPGATDAANNTGHIRLEYTFGGPGGGFALPFTREVTAMTKWLGHDVAAGDINGDGRVDLGLTYTGLSGSLPSSTLAKYSFWWQIGGRIVPFGRDFRTVMNLDRGAAAQVDSLISNVAAFPPDLVEPVYFGRYHHFLADVNGDRIADFIDAYIGAEGLRIDLGLMGSTGRISTSGLPDPTQTVHEDITTDFFDGNPHLFHTYVWRVADINGDRNADLLPIHAGSFGTYIQYLMGTSNGSTGFRVDASGMRRPIAMETAFNADWFYGADTFFEDVNADGKQDVVLINRYDSHLLTDTLRYYMSVPGEPDLVREVSNGFGGRTTVSYAPIAGAGGITPGPASFCTASNSGAPSNAATCGRSSTAHRAVVTRIVQSSGISAEIGEFEYEGARELDVPFGYTVDLGFARVVRRDPQSGISVDTVYRQDAPYHGRAVSKTVLDRAGVPLRREQLAWEQKAGFGAILETPRDGELPLDDQFVTVRLESSATTVFESGRPVHELTELYAYDAYHNLVRQDSCADSDCVVTRWKYNNYDTPWCNQLEARWKSRGSNMVDMERFSYFPAVASAGHHFKIFAHERLLHADAQAALCSGDREDYVAWCDTSRRPWRWVVLSQNHEYDGVGNEVSVQDTNGATTLTSFDAQYRAQPDTRTNPLGHRTRFTYDYAGRLATETDLDNNVGVTRAYDGLGRVTWISRPYSTASSPVVIEARERFDYPSWGVAPDSHRAPAVAQQHIRVTTTSAPGVDHVVLRFFDGFGRWWGQREVTADGEIISHRQEYYDAGGIKHVFYTRPYFEAAPGYLAGSPSATQKTWYEISYDREGRAASIHQWASPIAASCGSGPPDPACASALTSEGEIVRWRYAAGAAIGTHAITMERTGASGTFSRTDIFDGWNRRVAMIDELGKETLYGYDPIDQVRRVDLPNGELVTFSSDTWGRRRSMNDAATGLTRYAYYDTGELLVEMNALGERVSFAYDVLGRRRLEAPGSAPVLPVATRYEYDSLPGSTYAVGRLVRATHPAGSRELSYDAAGRVASRTVTMNGLADTAGNPRRFTHSFRYDWQDRPTWKQLPDGTQEDTVYHADGSLSEVRAGSGLSPRPLYARFKNYNALGQAGQRELFGGQSTPISTTTFAYDDPLERRRLSSLLTTSGGVEVQRLSYSYDSRGNVLSIDDDRPGSLKSVSGVSTDETQSFEYDELGRISRAVAAASYGTLSFAYDELGHFSNKGPITYSFAPPGCPAGSRCIRGTQGTRVPFFAVHDAAGRRTTLTDDRDLDGVSIQWAYSYDSYGRLKTVRRGGALADEYDYDDSGERIRKRYYHSPGNSSGTVTTTYYIAADYELRATSLNAGQEAKTKYVIVPGFGRISMITDGSVINGQPTRAMVSANRGRRLTGTTMSGMPPGTWIYLSNQIQTTSIVVDAQLGEVSRLVHMPFGEVARSPTAAFGSLGYDIPTHKFTGQEADEETGLTYFGARYYDELTGRFITPDTHLPGNLRDPQGFNRYAYVRNNPIRYIDPTGHEPEHSTFLAATDLVQGIRDGAFPMFFPASQGANNGYEVDYQLGRAIGGGIGLYGDLMAITWGLNGGVAGAASSPVTGPAGGGVSAVGVAVAGAGVVVAGVHIGVMADATTRLVVMASSGVSTPPSGASASAPPQQPKDGSTSQQAGDLAGNSGPVRNAHLAGKEHPKTGVPFDEVGYPDFSAYRHPDVPDVRIELSGSRSTDFARANAKAGLKETPSGYTWHHHQDKGLMQLVDRKIHAATGHTGGFSAK